MIHQHTSKTVSLSFDLMIKRLYTKKTRGKVSIRVKLPPILQQLSGIETCEVTGYTVGGCLKSLEMQFPNIKNYLLDRQGRLLGIFGIYLNSEGIYPVGLDTPVRDNDEIVILNFITGG